MGTIEEEKTTTKMKNLLLWILVCNFVRRANDKTVDGGTRIGWAYS